MCMDGVARVQDRLDRIETLAGAGAGREELLVEVRGLLEEGERLLRAEGAEPKAPAERSEEHRPGLGPQEKEATVA